MRSAGAPSGRTRVEPSRAAIVAPQRADAYGHGMRGVGERPAPLLLAACPSPDRVADRRPAPHFKNPSTIRNDVTLLKNFKKKKKIIFLKITDFLILAFRMQKKNRRKKKRTAETRFHFLIQKVPCSLALFPARRNCQNTCNNSLDINSITFN